MFSRKFSFYAVLFLTFSACTKKDLTPAFEINPAPQNDSAALWPKQIFGLMIAEGTIDETKTSMSTAEVNIVRVPVFLSQTTYSKTVDDYLHSGYNVQINLNWQNTASGAVSFPTDTNLLRRQAKEFFKYYKPYIKQIPIIVVENEWDNPNYHSGSIKDYLNELTIITRLAHRFGFKVTDAGITSSALQRWTYSQLTGTDATWWRQHYYVGLDNNYDTLVNIVNSYIGGVKKIDIDFTNVHWYNTNWCNNGFKTATAIYKQACGKNAVICNEFGIRTNSTELYNETVNEIKGNAVYALAYSGTTIITGKAIKLSDEMLQMLR